MIMLNTRYKYRKKFISILSINHFIGCSYRRPSNNTIQLQTRPEHGLIFLDLICSFLNVIWNMNQKSCHHVYASRHIYAFFLKLLLLKVKLRVTRFDTLYVFVWINMF